MGDVLDDLRGVGLDARAGVAEGGLGGPAHSPATAIARLVLRHWQTHSSCHPSLYGQVCAQNSERTIVCCSKADASGEMAEHP